MNATALARTTLEFLISQGVSDVVLSPGSRNAPLSFALADLDRAGLVRLHVRIDERSAAFLALGLAKGSGRPVAVCATSGTAIANFHPAVVEADLSGTPLVVLSANRPLSMQGTGANQVIDQVGIFSSAARACVHLSDDDPGGWPRGLVDVADAISGRNRGPVQLDLSFSEPLTPPDGQPWVPSVAESDGSTAESDGSPAETDGSTAESDGSSAVSDGSTVGVELGARTLVLVAETEPQLARSAVEQAVALGFPVHIEAGTSLVASIDGVLQCGSYLLRSSLLQVAKPQSVLVIGRPTLARQIPALVADPDIDVRFVHARPGIENPMGTGISPIIADQLTLQGSPDPEFAERWRAADEAATRARDLLLRKDDEPLDAPTATRVIYDEQPDLLVVASSNPIRDLDGVAPRRRQEVLVNRGAAGIDGLVSTSVGAALARGDNARSLALLGDLAFLHDINGLLIGPDEPRPALTIVVVNNDGGAIFASLEQGAPEYAGTFERVFGTPHCTRIADLCSAYGVPHTSVRTPRELTEALAAPATQLTVIEAHVSRESERGDRMNATAAVVQAIDATLA